MTPGRVTVSLLGRAALFALIWWALSEGRPDAWAMGVVAVAAALWASLRLVPPAPRRLSATGLLGFAGFFVWHSIRAGLQVALMALRAPRAMHPAVMELQLALPAGMARVLMTSALSLMPGTLTVRLDGDRLHVHVLDRRLPVAANARALEARIAGILGEGP